MKKITCSKVKTLDDSELHKVVGGSKMSEISDKVNEAVCRAASGNSNCDGCGSKSSSLHKAISGNRSSNKKNNTGGCNSRSSGGGGGSSRVICTHFYRKGLIERDVWRADLEFTELHLSETTVKGYHYWAVPYVELMRKNKFFESIMLPIAKYRAYELAHRMKVRDKGSLRGKLIRLVIEPVCYMIGLFCDQKDWQKLWIND